MQGEKEEKERKIEKKDRRRGCGEKRGGKGENSSLGCHD